jgi:lauroyl/myristoyl acyltransferase
MPLSLRALLYRRPAEPSAITVEFDCETYPVRLRRNRLARRYTLRIRNARSGADHADARQRQAGQ